MGVVDVAARVLNIRWFVVTRESVLIHIQVEPFRFGLIGRRTHGAGSGVSAIQTGVTVGREPHANVVPCLRG